MPCSLLALNTSINWVKVLWWFLLSLHIRTRNHNLILFVFVLSFHLVLHKHFTIFNI